jgi:hypothetical protein
MILTHHLTSFRGRRGSCLNHRLHLRLHLKSEGPITSSCRIHRGRHFWSWAFTATSGPNRWVQWATILSCVARSGASKSSRRVGSLRGWRPAVRRDPGHKEI